MFIGCPTILIIRSGCERRLGRVLAIGEIAEAPLALVIGIPAKNKETNKKGLNLLV
jgi:hypothetical protein